jgi:hypothetical protein
VPWIVKFDVGVEDSRFQLEHVGLEFHSLGVRVHQCNLEIEDRECQRCRQLLRLVGITVRSASLIRVCNTFVAGNSFSEVWTPRNSVMLMSAERRRQ